MVDRADNERMSRVEGDAPLGRLMRENFWIPFTLSEALVAGEAPTPVRLFGLNYVAFRAPDGRIGFLDELCPHRRASLLLARAEDSGPVDFSWYDMKDMTFTDSGRIDVS